MNITINGITRQMTAAEQTELDTARQQIANDIAAGLLINPLTADEIKVKNTARQAVLDKLGLSADEAAALLG